MDSIKGLLVPVNYKGQWVKGDDQCWTYDGLLSRFVRLKPTTTYNELVDMICDQTGIDRNCNEIEVRCWTSYPSKEMSPPFIMFMDEDISTYIDINANRKLGVPLCITATEKEKEVVRSVEPILHDDGKKELTKSKSVNKPLETTPYREDIGLDDIKLSNPVDLSVGVGDTYVSHEGSMSENWCSNDEFDYSDAFNYEEGYDVSNCGDPFDTSVDDSFFRKFVGKFGTGKNEEAPPAPIPVSPAHTNAAQSSIAESRPRVAPNARPPRVEKGSKSEASGPSDTQSTNVHLLKDFNVGDLVKTKGELLIRLRVASMKANREIKVTHSNRQRVLLRCVDIACKWRARALLKKSNGMWLIARYEKEHTCSIDARSKRVRGTATCSAIAHMIDDGETKPKQIMEQFERNYGIKIGYWKAWKAKELSGELARGSPEYSFLGLPSYFWLLERANPGTMSAYTLDNENRFEQCFLAFGQSLNGFKSSIRPVIAVDACFLKGRYKGKLFIATCMDGNNQIYPLAFGVAATENDMSWGWFFNKLRGAVGSTEDLVFISDRHPSIEKCCKNAFPDAVYGICSL